MKRKILLFAMAVLGTFVFAASPVLTVNGEQVQRTPASLSFDGDNVIVHFTDGTETYDMGAVVFTYLNSGLADIQTMVYTGMVGDLLTIGGVREGTRAEVYDAAGRRVAAAQTTATGCSIDLSGAAGGVYVLRIDNKIVKFVKH